MKRRTFFIAFCFMVMVAFISTATESRKEGSVLHDLKNVEELKSAFNEDNGNPRLLLLLSPT